MSDSASRHVGSLEGLAVAMVRSWWPQVLTLMAACAIVATTIIGALAVGSSLQHGLRSLALERLGHIEAAIVSESFFTSRLAEQLQTDAARGGPNQIVPAIVMPITVSTGRGGTTAAMLLACDDPAALGYDPAPPPLMPDRILINGPLAESLGLRAGDDVVLRIPRASNVPADSPLGRRTGESDGRRMAVAAVLPTRGIGQFSLRPEQSTRPLVVSSLATARRILGRDDAVNAVFAVGMAPGGDAGDWLRTHMNPTLADYGLAFERASTVPASLRLTTSRLILSTEADDAARAVLVPIGGTPTLVMLANTIAVGTDATAGVSVPYSTVLGIDSTSLPVGKLVDATGNLIPLPADDGIVIDQWLADDCAAQGRPLAIGDTITLTYFEPETVHGKVVEASATLAITGIAAMQGAATCRGVVPEVEGITDEDSITDWDPPFPFDAARVRSTPPNDQDDQYWKKYGPTPKAFVSLATARRLAGSRFGGTTAWLVPEDAIPNAAAVENDLARRMTPDRMGLRIQPLLHDAIDASRGSTPFGVLFLSLSSFVVVAGLLLAWLLFSLLVTAHRRDLGILTAIGWPPQRITRLLITIGGLAAVGGAVVGAVVGPLWARVLLLMLGRQWATEVDPGAAAVFAIAPPEPAAVLAGAVASIVVSLLALAVAARRAGRAQPLRLLRDTDRPVASASCRRSWPALAVAGCGIVAAVVMAFQGRQVAAESMVGIFFASGASALTGLLATAWLWLSSRPSPTPVRTLRGLARRNLAVAPSRAFSVAAIVAIATFLVVAVSSFSQRLPTDLDDREGPTGGWTEIVSFGSTTGVDPSDPTVRTTLGLSSAQEKVIAACAIARLRSSDGDDAACTNLYAAMRPTVLGVGPGFLERGGFRFVSHADLPGPTAGNAWRLLETPRPIDAPLPAILDQATAQWGLKLGGVGSRFTMDDDAGHPITFEIVGLLEPGILQGFVIVGERNFERAYPERSGYRMALVDASAVPPGQRADVFPALAAAWADAGPTVTAASKRLASLQAVQNTFLSGFQALGALGLLLGTAGVAAVQAQGTLERTGSLAVLRAVGFTLARVRLMLVFETISMVCLGLAVGVASGCLAVAPSLIGGSARVPITWIVIVSGGSLAAAIVAASAAASRYGIPSRPPAE
jgi:ABC-type lipoprotein release transport system permease subunit